MVASRSASALTLDPAALAARWRARGVSSASFDAAVLPALLPPERVAAQEAALEAAAREAPPSRDDRPVSFLRALARRQQVVSGSAGRLLALARGLPPAALVLLALLPSLFALARLRARTAAATARAAATHAVAATGAAGLGWSLVLLLSFQAHAGVLYGLLGALVAVFMLGLALGGALAAGKRAAAAGPMALAGAARGLRAWLLAAAALLLRPAAGARRRRPRLGARHGGGARRARRPAARGRDRHGRPVPARRRAAARGGRHRRGGGRGGRDGRPRRRRGRRAVRCRAVRAAGRAGALGAPAVRSPGAGGVRCRVGGATSG